MFNIFIRHKLGLNEKEVSTETWKYLITLEFFEIKIFRENLSN